MKEFPLPAGTQDSPEDLQAEVRTFLIADVRDYTRFTQDRGDEAGAQLAAKFARIVREGVQDRGGDLVELRGDEALSVFHSARRALRCAVDLQTRFTKEGQDDPTLPLAVGIGIDAGEAVRVERGYRGGALNVAARLCSRAYGGQILASETVVHLARKVEGIEYVPLGPAVLKGLSEPVSVVQVRPENAASPTALDHTSSPRESVRMTGGNAERSALPVGGFVGALPPGPLVGRNSELQPLLALLEDVAEGRGRFVVLTGEPGVGKTRLAQEIAVQALERRFLLAAGICYEQRQSVPYYPFTEALSALYVATPSSIQDEVGRRWPYLAAIVPDLVDRPTELEDRSGEAQERLYKAVSDFILSAAGGSPVALILDDLQWADEASLELLQYLARHTRVHPALILGACRDDEASRSVGLDAALLDLNRHQLVDWVPVRRLSLDALADLVPVTIGPGDVSVDFVRLLHERTDGNPFFAQEILRSLVDRGELVPKNGRWTGRSVKDIQVPARIRAVIGQRLAMLSPLALDVLRVASVLGKTFSFDDLLRMSDCAEEELEQALENAKATGLIAEVSDEVYAFDQSLTRQAIYEGLPGRRRKRLHLAAGRALETRRGSRSAPGAGELSWHFLQGDDADRALTYAVAAGDEAEAVFAHSEAEQHYRTALEVVRGMNEPGGEAPILEKLGAVLRIVGRYDEALEYLERAVQTFETLGDMDGARRSLAQAVTVLAQTGKVDQGIARLQPMLDAQSEHEGESLALLFIAESSLQALAGRFQASEAAAERAVHVASRASSPRILAEAELRRGEAIGMQGRYEQARQILESVLELKDGIAPATLIDALVGLGGVSLLSGEFEQSRTYRSRALDLAQQLAEPRATVMALAALSDTLAYLGEWQEAQTLLDSAFPLARSFDMTRLVARLEISSAILLLRRGELSAAREQLQTVLGTSLSGAGLRDEWGAEIGLAEIDMVEGHPEEARIRLQTLLDTYNNDSTRSPLIMLTLAQALVALGRVSPAEQLIEQAMTLSVLARDRILFVKGLGLRGMVRRRQGNSEEASRLFLAALVVATRMPYPYRRARILYEMGLLHLEQSNYASAVPYLQEALFLFQHLGARHHEQATASALSNVKGQL